MNSEERKIIESILNGKTDAFEELIDLYQKRVYLICLRFMKNEQDARDMSQEVFIKIYNRLDRYHQKSSFSTWLYTLCANTCLDELRKQKRVKLIYESDCSELKTELTPEEIIKSREFKELVESSIGKMDDINAEVMKRRLFQNETYQDISNAVGIPASTARTKFSRGRKKIIGAIKKYLKEE